MLTTIERDNLFKIETTTTTTTSTKVAFVIEMIKVGTMSLLKFWMLLLVLVEVVRCKMRIHY